MNHELDSLLIAFEDALYGRHKFGDDQGREEVNAARDALHAHVAALRERAEKAERELASLRSALGEATDIQYLADGHPPYPGPDDSMLAAAEHHRRQSLEYAEMAGRAERAEAKLAKVKDVVDVVFKFGTKHAYEAFGDHFAKDALMDALGERNPDTAVREALGDGETSTR